MTQRVKALHLAWNFEMSLLTGSQSRPLPSPKLFLKRLLPRYPRPNGLHHQAQKVPSLTVGSFLTPCQSQLCGTSGCAGLYRCPGPFANYARSYDH